MLDKKPVIHESDIQLEDNEHHEFLLILDNTGLFCLKKNTGTLLEWLNHSEDNKHITGLESAVMIHIRVLQEILKE